MKFLKISEHAPAGIQNPDISRHQCGLKVIRAVGRQAAVARRQAAWEQRDGWRAAGGRPTARGLVTADGWQALDGEQFILIDYLFARN